MNLLHAVRSKNYFKNKTAPKWMNESISVRFFLRVISDASTLPRLVCPLIIPPKSGML
mgnify:FL=1